MCILLDNCAWGRRVELSRGTQWMVCIAGDCGIKKCGTADVSGLIGSLRLSLWVVSDQGMGVRCLSGWWNSDLHAWGFNWVIDNHIWHRKEGSGLGRENIIKNQPWAELMQCAQREQGPWPRGIYSFWYGRLGVKENPICLSFLNFSFWLLVYRKCNRFLYVYFILQLLSSSLMWAIIFVLVIYNVPRQWQFYLNKSGIGHPRLIFWS